MEKKEIIERLEKMIEEKEAEMDNTVDTYHLQSIIGYIDGLKKSIEVIRDVMKWL